MHRYSKNKCTATEDISRLEGQQERKQSILIVYRRGAAVAGTVGASITLTDLRIATMSSTIIRGPTQQTEHGKLDKEGSSRKQGPF